MSEHPLEPPKGGTDRPVFISCGPPWGIPSRDALPSSAAIFFKNLFSTRLFILDFHYLKSVQRIFEY